MTDHDERLGHALRELDVPSHGPGFYSRLAERLDQEPTHRRPRRHRPGWIRPPMLLSLGAIAAVVVAVMAMSSIFRGDRPDVRVEAGGGTIPATTGVPTPTSLPSIDPTTAPTTGPATGPTPGPTTKVITFQNITFYAPTTWDIQITGDSAVVGTLAGGRQDVPLLVKTGFTDSIDTLVPTVCNGFPLERPSSVEVSESGFRPVGDRSAEFRLWTSTCPTRGLEVHRAWVLPTSRIAIYEQNSEGHPENVSVVTTAAVQ
jgi:hypothetical protein